MGRVIYFVYLNGKIPPKQGGYMMWRKKKDPSDYEINMPTLCM